MLTDAIEVASLSDKGKVRAFNEDSVAADREHGLLVLADGMGGHKAGDVASGMATSMLLGELRDKLDRLEPGEVDPGSGYSMQSFAVKTAVNRANLAIHHAAGRGHEYRGMGTTLALALFYNNRVTLAHVGDSRIYRLRRGRLELLTRDDSLLRAQIEQGVIAAEEARASHNRALVTRALGVEEQVQVSLQEQDVWAGDVYLLCSDGLNDMVDDADIEAIVEGLQANLPLAARTLVEAANDHGGRDNVSVMLARVRQPFPAEAASPGVLGRLFGWFK